MKTIKLMTLMLAGWAMTAAAGPLVKIGETGYNTLEAACDAVQNGQTITFLQDFDAGSYAEFKSEHVRSNVTFDLGGHTVTITDGYVQLGCYDWTGTVVSNGTFRGSGEPASNHALVELEQTTLGKGLNVIIDGTAYGAVHCTDGMTPSGIDTDGEIRGPVEGDPYGYRFFIRNGSFTNSVINGFVRVQGGTWDSDPHDWVDAGYESYKLDETHWGVRPASGPAAYTPYPAPADLVINGTPVSAGSGEGWSIDETEYGPKLVLTGGSYLITGANCANRFHNPIVTGDADIVLSNAVFCTDGSWLTFDNDTVSTLTIIGHNAIATPDVDLDHFTGENLAGVTSCQPDMIGLKSGAKLTVNIGEGETDETAVLSTLGICDVDWETPASATINGGTIEMEEFFYYDERVGAALSNFTKVHTIEKPFKLDGLWMDFQDEGNFIVNAGRFYYTFVRYDASELANFQAVAGDGVAATFDAESGYVTFAFDPLFTVSYDDKSWSKGVATFEAANELAATIISLGQSVTVTLMKDVEITDSKIFNLAAYGALDGHQGWKPVSFTFDTNGHTLTRLLTEDDYQANGGEAVEGALGVVVDSDKVVLKVTGGGRIELICPEGIVENEMLYVSALSFGTTESYATMGSTPPSYYARAIVSNVTLRAVNLLYGFSFLAVGVDTEIEAGTISDCGMYFNRTSHMKVNGGEFGGVNFMDMTGTIDFYGGRFENVIINASWMSEGDALRIHGGDFDCDESQLSNWVVSEITGGRFSFDPSSWVSAPAEVFALGAEDAPYTHEVARLIGLTIDGVDVGKGKGEGWYVGGYTVPEDVCSFIGDSDNALVINGGTHVLSGTNTEHTLQRMIITDDATIILSNANVTVDQGCPDGFVVMPGVKLDLRLVGENELHQYELYPYEFSYLIWGMIFALDDAEITVDVLEGADYADGVLSISEIAIGAEEDSGRLRILGGTIDLSATMADEWLYVKRIEVIGGRFLEYQDQYSATIAGRVSPMSYTDFDSGVWTVRPTDEEPIVSVTFDDTGVVENYVDLQRAFDDAVAADTDVTVRLLKDVQLTTAVGIGISYSEMIAEYSNVQSLDFGEHRWGRITFDLGGHELSMDISDGEAAPLDHTAITLPAVSAKSGIAEDVLEQEHYFMLYINPWVYGHLEITNGRIVQRGTGEVYSSEVIDSLISEKVQPQYADAARDSAANKLFGHVGYNNSKLAFMVFGNSGKMSNDLGYGLADPYDVVPEIVLTDVEITAESTGTLPIYVTGNLTVGEGTSITGAGERGIRETYNSSTHQWGAEEGPIGNMIGLVGSFTLDGGSIANIGKFFSEALPYADWGYVFKAGSMSNCVFSLNTSYIDINTGHYSQTAFGCTGGAITVFQGMFDRCTFDSEAWVDLCGGLYTEEPPDEYLQVSGCDKTPIDCSPYTWMVGYGFTGITVDGVDVAVGFGDGWYVKSDWGENCLYLFGDHVIAGTNSYPYLTYMEPMSDGTITLDHVDLEIQGLLLEGSVRSTLLLVGENCFRDMCDSYDEGAVLYYSGGLFLIRDTARLTIDKASGYTDETASLVIGSVMGLSSEAGFTIAGGKVYNATGAVFADGVKPYGSYAEQMWGTEGETLSAVKFSNVDIRAEGGRVLGAADKNFSTSAPDEEYFRGRLAAKIDWRKEDAWYIFYEAPRVGVWAGEEKLADFARLKDAFDFAATLDEEVHIRVEEDLKDKDEIVVSSRNVTLDGGGHTIANAITVSKGHQASPDTLVYVGQDSDSNSASIMWRDPENPSIYRISGRWGNVASTDTGYIASLGFWIGEGREKYLYSHETGSDDGMSGTFTRQELPGNEMFEQAVRDGDVHGMGGHCIMPPDDGCYELTIDTENMTYRFKEIAYDDDEVKYISGLLDSGDITLLQGDPEDPEAYPYFNTVDDNYDIGGDLYSLPIVSTAAYGHFECGNPDSVNSIPLKAGDRFTLAVGSTFFGVAEPVTPDRTVVELEPYDPLTDNRLVIPVDGRYGFYVDFRAGKLMCLRLDEPGESPAGALKITGGNYTGAVNDGVVRYRRKATGSAPVKHLYLFGEASGEVGPASIPLLEQTETPGVYRTVSYWGRIPVISDRFYGDYIMEEDSLDTDMMYFTSGGAAGAMSGSLTYGTPPMMASVEAIQDMLINPPEAGWYELTVDLNELTYAFAEYAPHRPSKVMDALYGGADAKFGVYDGQNAVDHDMVQVGEFCWTLEDTLSLQAGDVFYVNYGGEDDIWSPDAQITDNSITAGLIMATTYGQVHAYPVAESGDYHVTVNFADMTITMVRVGHEGTSGSGSRSSSSGGTRIEHLWLIGEQANTSSVDNMQALEETSVPGIYKTFGYWSCGTEELPSWTTMYGSVICHEFTPADLAAMNLVCYIGQDGVDGALSGTLLKGGVMDIDTQSAMLNPPAPGWYELTIDLNAMAYEFTPVEPEIPDETVADAVLYSGETPVLMSLEYDIPMARANPNNPYVWTGTIDIIDGPNEGVLAVVLDGAAYLAHDAVITDTAITAGLFPTWSEPDLFGNQLTETGTFRVTVDFHDMTITMQRVGHIGVIKSGNDDEDFEWEELDVEEIGGELEITGGTFIHKPHVFVPATGYDVEENASKPLTWTVYPWGTGMCEVTYPDGTTKGFHSLSAALRSCPEGTGELPPDGVSTIRLLQDVTVEHTGSALMYIGQRNVTLDLNGYRLDLDGTWSEDAAERIDSGFVGNAPSMFEITDSSEAGTGSVTGGVQARGGVYTGTSAAAGFAVTGTVLEGNRGADGAVSSEGAVWFEDATLTGNCVADGPDAFVVEGYIGGANTIGSLKLLAGSVAPLCLYGPLDGTEIAAVTLVDDNDEPVMGTITDGYWANGGTQPKYLAVAPGVYGEHIAIYMNDWGELEIGPAAVVTIPYREGYDCYWTWGTEYVTNVVENGTFVVPLEDENVTVFYKAWPDYNFDRTSWTYPGPILLDYTLVDEDLPMIAVPYAWYLPKGKVAAETLPYGVTYDFNDGRVKIWRRRNGSASFDFAALEEQAISGDTIYFNAGDVEVDGFEVGTNALVRLVFAGDPEAGSRLVAKGDRSIFAVGDEDASPFAAGKPELPEITWSNLVFTVSETAVGGYDGGAIAQLGGRFRIVECDFTGAFAEEFGGAVFAAGVDYGAIERSRFLGCEVNDMNGIGGAVYASARAGATGTPLLEVTDCTFRDNSAEQGGAIATTTAYDDGEAPIALAVSGCVFERNLATYLGGAIAAEGDVAVDADGEGPASSFSGNAAGYAGGALGLTRIGDFTPGEGYEIPEVAIGGGAARVVFENNFTETASANGSVYGGALAFLSPAAVSVTGADFNGNRALALAATNGGAYGGAVFADDGVALGFLRAAFAGNTAAADETANGAWAIGGAVYSCGTLGALEMMTSVFTGNCATAKNAIGGAIEIDTVGASTVCNTTFRGNLPEAIDLYESPLDILNSVVVDNGADELVVSEGGSITACHSAFGCSPASWTAAENCLGGRTAAIYAGATAKLDESAFNPVAALGYDWTGDEAFAKLGSDFDGVVYGSKECGRSMGAYECATPPLTVTLTANKIYDGTTVTNLDEGSSVGWKLTGADGEETVWDDLGDVADAFTLTNFTFGARDAGYYANTNEDAVAAAAFSGSEWLRPAVRFVFEGTVGPRTVTITWDHLKWHQYNGDEFTHLATLGNLVEGDEVECVYTGERATEVGNYLAEVTALAGAEGGNYTLPTDGSTEDAWRIVVYEALLVHEVGPGTWTNEYAWTGSQIAPTNDVLVVLGDQLIEVGEKTVEFFDNIDMTNGATVVVTCGGEHPMVITNHFYITAYFVEHVNGAAAPVCREQIGALSGQTVSCPATCDEMAAKHPGFAFDHALSVTNGVVRKCDGPDPLVLTVGYSPDVHGTDDPEAGDGVPDRYQKRVVFKVVNGLWNDGLDGVDRFRYVTLFDAAGEYSESGTGALAEAQLPAAGSSPANSQYTTGGVWWPAEPEDGTVVASDAFGVYLFAYNHLGQGGRHGSSSAVAPDLWERLKFVDFEIGSGAVNGQIDLSVYDGESAVAEIDPSTLTLTVLGAEELNGEWTSVGEVKPDADGNWQLSVGEGPHFFKVRVK